MSNRCRTWVELAMAMALLAAYFPSSAQQSRHQISERWNDQGWSHVIVKLKSGEEIAYARHTLWGLFYSYGAQPAAPAPSPAPGSNPAPPAAPTSPRLAQPAAFAGTWNVDCNGYTGKLEIVSMGGGWSGRINLAEWETLQDIRIDAGRGTISFFRHIGEQRYTGTLDGNRITGKFTYAGATYNWSATR